MTLSGFCDNTKKNRFYDIQSKAIVTSKDVAITKKSSKFIPKDTSVSVEIILNYKDA